MKLREPSLNVGRARARDSDKQLTQLCVGGRDFDITFIGRGMNPRNDDHFELSAFLVGCDQSEGVFHIICSFRVYPFFGEAGLLNSISCSPALQSSIAPHFIWLFLCINSRRLPFGRLWYGEPDAIGNAVGYAKFYSRSHDAVIRVYDEAGNVIETHEHAGEFKEW